ncbi:hypothetical protein BUH_1506 [Burkholderia pseudomallei Pakistan 9]|nr:hypothetical protein BUH_1506 [Burkholderia pseudomallei Pakistan 9]
MIRRRRTARRRRMYGHCRAPVKAAKNVRQKQAHVYVEITE